MLVKLDHFHTTGGVGSINTAMSSVSSSKAACGDLIHQNSFQSCITKRGISHSRGRISALKLRTECPESANHQGVHLYTPTQCQSSHKADVP